MSMKNSSDTIGNRTCGGAVHQPTAPPLTPCGICTCIYYNNNGLMVCGICTCIYLYYDCVTGMNIEKIITNFSPPKLKRNCKHLSYTSGGWYMFHIVAVTDD